MATYLEYLSFKAKLPWYKKILFPLFLNKKEYSEYIKIVTDEKSDLDKARDYYFYCWNEYMNNKTFYNESRMKDARYLLEMYIKKEVYENNHPGRDN